jgi:hypothetical protein
MWPFEPLTSSVLCNSTSQFVTESLKVNLYFCLSFTLCRRTEVKVEGSTHSEPRSASRSGPLIPSTDCVGSRAGLDFVTAWIRSSGRQTRGQSLRDLVCKLLLKEDATQFKQSDFNALKSVSILSILHLRKSHFF